MPEFLRQGGRVTLRPSLPRAWPCSERVLGRRWGCCTCLVAQPSMRAAGAQKLRGLLPMER
eukprot:6386612-Prymnesium_polylepis.1